MRKHVQTFTVIVFFTLLLSGCGSNSMNPQTPNTTPNNISEPAEDTNENSPQNEDPDQWVEISFVGDVMMDSVIGDYISAQGVDYPWSEVSPLLTVVDIAVANLETSVSTRGTTKKPEGYGFRSHPKTLSGLKNSGFDLVSLANNHSLDFGRDALADTMAYLDEQQIAYTGAGANSKEAQQLAILERNGLKIGFLAYTSIVPEQSWIATDDTPGIAPLKPDYYESILRQIATADQECDILILLLHWGKEHVDQVEPWQRELARKMIDNGADAIVGHHPHVLRGIEFYQNKPVVYSTGNFVFLKKDDKAGRTAIFTLRLNKDGFIQGAINPVFISYAKANLLKENSEKYNTIITEMTALSKPLGTTFTPQGKFFPSTE